MNLRMDKTSAMLAVSLAAIIANLSPREVGILADHIRRRPRSRIHRKVKK